jgi:uncharacterized protein
LSIYLDTSVLVSLFVEDAGTRRADAFLRGHPDALVVSDFAEAEFAAAIARRVRMGDVTKNQAQTVFAAFDVWKSGRTQRLPITTADVASAAIFTRRLDLTLRAPDAIHIAIAQRLGANLFTFDTKMAASARALEIKALD